MTVWNGTINGVTLLAAPLEGQAALNGSAVATRKAFLVTATFPSAYTGSTDSATITGILTAIAAAERNGKALTLIGVIPVNPGIDGSSPAQGVHFDAASHGLITLSNTTTTGDAAANLADASGTELTSTTGATVGVGIIATVDEV